MDYQSANETKASFDAVYNSPTPHNYFKQMSSLGYEIGQQAQPYFSSVVEWMNERSDDHDPVQMLDLGCSYGVGSALVKYQFHLDEVVEFFKKEAPTDFDPCVESTRQWLSENSDPIPVRCIGVDCSAEAIGFAEEAGLIDGGIAKNFEEDAKPTDRDLQLIRESDLLTSTGAIGYVGDKTLSVLLSGLGKSNGDRPGPCSVVTILRMFKPDVVQESFNRFGYRFEPIPGVLLRQRSFADEKEQQGTIDILKEMGLDYQGLEDQGDLYAGLYAAAPESEFEMLRDRLLETHAALRENSSLKRVAA